MKKILIIILMLISLISVNNAKAATNDSEVKIEWIPNVYYNYKKDGLIYWGQLGYIYANGIISYCTDITMTITTDVYSSSVNISLPSKTDLIIYYGYGYDGNDTLKDHMATQALVWEKYGYDVYFTTESYAKGSTIDISENKNKIMNLVNSHGTMPNFSELFKFELGSTNTLTDNNNVLNNMKVTNTSDNEIVIDENKLVINANKKGSFSFNLTTQYTKRFSNKSFTASGSQSLVQIGYVNNKFKKYNYTVSGGSLQVNLYDDLTKTIENTGSTTFKGNIFELYNGSGTLLGTYETMEDGKIYIDGLDIGTYTLKHSYISEGYNKEKEVYTIKITKDNIYQTLDIYLKPKTIEFKINKSYGNPIVGTKYFDNNVTFTITNSEGKIVEEITTDEHGDCNTTLVYDTYTIKQKDTNNVNEYANDYTINKNEFDRNHEYIIFTPIYTAKLKVFLYELGTTLPISNSKFKVNDIDYITNEEGYFITDELNKNTYVLVQENLEGYIKLDDVTVIIDENSNYYIENNEVYIDVVVYNEKVLIEEPEEVPKEDEEIAEEEIKDDVLEEDENSEETPKDEEENPEEEPKSDDENNDNLNDEEEKEDDVKEEDKEDESLEEEIKDNVPEEDENSEETPKDEEENSEEEPKSDEEKEENDEIKEDVSEEGEETPKDEEENLEEEPKEEIPEEEPENDDENNDIQEEDDKLENKLPIEDNEEEIEKEPVDEEKKENNEDSIEADKEEQIEEELSAEENNEEIENAPNEEEKEIITEEDIEKLPYLGITNYSDLLKIGMILFIRRIRYVKKDSY